MCEPFRLAGYHPSLFSSLKASEHFIAKVNNNLLLINILSFENKGEVRKMLAGYKLMQTGVWMRNKKIDGYPEIEGNFLDDLLPIKQI